MPSWAKSLSEHRTVIEAVESVLALHLDPAVSLLEHCLAGGGKILACGNGGSATQADHLIAELVVRFATDRRALASVSLLTGSILTACANDYGYDHVFARQVEAIGNPGDVLVALSTSGRSANVNEAVRKAKHRGLATLGLSGRRGIEAGVDVDLAVPSESTARIQEAHSLIIHLLCETLDQRIPKGPDPNWKHT